MKDVLGNDIVPGDRVGCAFSYSQASVGTIRLGEVVEIRTGTNRWGSTEVQVKCRWDRDTSKVSPWMSYSDETRWIKI